MLVDREISSVELTEAVLGQIDAVGEKTKAYLLVTRELARRQAQAADERLRANRDVKPLTGIPIALKDVLCVQDVVSTAGSKILKGFSPPYSATVVERLEAEGAVFLGKTNCDEFAMGSSNENSGYRPVHNPFGLDRVPGGSSGGSAAAVASGEAIAAIGSDTGGSVRQPAALTGIVGMKPTYGRVSRYGLIAFASSLDQVGPLTKDVADCAILLQAIAGHDAKDSTSSPHPVPDYPEHLAEGVPGHTRGGLRPRGAAPDHARHLCAQLRLLRRLLPAGPEGEDADHRGLRACLPAGRRPDQRDLAHRRLSPGSQDPGPGGHVPERHPDPSRQPGQRMWHLGPLRPGGQPPGRAAGDRTRLSRGPRPAGGLRLRDRRRLQQAALAADGGGCVMAIATRYEVVIGLEGHAQILTESTRFCGGATNHLTAPPNSNTCPVCLALPGSLPVINRRAVEQTIRTGLALSCEIPEFTKFDRKNYFYPDLPKGYQISQYDLPLSRKGYLEFEVNGEPRH